ncbi:MAG: alpha-N-acetylglucosaminidase [Bacteroidaceae bacterium]|nr:alpha-N-acetylglucosaminidase [Bacteroidaceae bacterium]
MKKTTLLTLLLAVLGVATGRAEFSPEAGKMYALKESTSGLYLDIQTLGINEPNAYATTDNISLNAKPCIIYFEAGADGKWKMRNANGTYAMQASSRNWNAVIGATAYEWTIAEPETGLYTIARADGKYISMDNAASGSPLYCDKDTGLKFSLVEYSSSLAQGYYALKSSTGTYFSFTEHSTGTKASFQSAPSYLYIIPSIDICMFEDKANAGTYISSAQSGWNVTTGTASLWTLSEPDEEGYVTITRHGDATKHLGSDQNTDVGTGIFTNVGIGCNKWLLEGTFDCTTAGTVSNNKYTFTSGKILYAALCNTLRFTLTESGATYQNGAKRMSFDSFELYDASGNKVALEESYFNGNYNKSYAGMLDGVNAGANGAGCCCGAWSSAAEGDDYFEISLPNDINLGGAFSFSFVTENTTMNAKAFRIDFRYEQREEVKYTFAVNAPEGKEFTVTYNSEDIAVGTELDNDFDTELFAATEIPGYTWSIVVDEEHATVTLVYTKAEVTENPEPVVALVGRIGGAGTAEKFKFVLDPSLNSKQETFVLGSEEGKILVKGTTISAITTGLGWYLNHIAHINISWNSLNEKTVAVKNEGAAYADLSNLPLPTVEETHVSDAKYRYYLNTCTFGYSMTSWTWTRWQQEIDWMALHGINMPLQLVGLEEVWRKFLTMEDENGNRKYGYDDESAKAFVAGPAFIAWWAMNNLEGWGGTGSGTKSGGTWAGAGGVQDDAWYVRQTELAGKIVDAQRALGMQPVLPGWSGMVPTNFASKSGYATRSNGDNWAGDFVRPLLLSVSNANYAEIAADYYACLKEVMGESQYYSMDPFHEGGGAGTMEDYEALYAAMEAAKAGSQWVIQQWQWSATQRYSLTAVPAGRLIVLDLFSDGSPAFDNYNGYAPQDAVFCAIPNFGGRSGLMGRLQNVTDNYFKFKEKYASIKGIGAAPEAIEQTPVTYDLIFQLPWMNGVKPDVAKWVDNYAVARYGQDNAVVKEAWSLLRQGPLNYGADGIQGPVEDVWAARPNLDAKPASAWGKTINQAGGIYTRARRQMLIDATYKLLSQHEALGLAEGSVYESNYNYDLVEFIGAVMADYAYDLLLGIKEKHEEGMVNSAYQYYQTRKDGFLNLLLGVDAFKGTNLNFRLGKWTQEARDAAAEVEGATTATADWYEFNNARTIVSTWSSPGTNLNDYSYRSWQGLIKDLYYPRWKYFFDHECEAGEYQFFEWNWAHGMTHEVGQTTVSTTRLTEGEAGYAYTREPEGNTVEKAKEILDKYIVPLQIGDSTYYAYRHLNNDLSPMITVVAEPGETIDVSPYFISLHQVHVYGDFIDHEDNRCADLSQIPVRSDIADGVYIATVDLNDGTMLEFAVVINPAYGVYNINYKDGDKDAPVFVGYNEDKDNSNNVGYKLIAEGTYSADALADKMFIIEPNGTGYSISAQGKYLKQPTLDGWNHIMFSDNAAEAGTYIFEETTTADLFKLKSTGTGINYVNDYDKLVFGNDKSDKENLATFTLSQVESYTLTVSSAGMATLCLPFNVMLPAGSMTAYDFASTNVMEEGEGAYICIMQSIAGSGNTLKAGTPVIVKAEPGNYDLKITMEGSGAKTSLPGSLLRGNFMKKELVQGTDVKKFILTNGDKGLGFYRMQESGTIGANKCWMEWTTPEGQAEARSFRIRFEQGETGIANVESQPTGQYIYNLAGQRLSVPQKGINIIGNKKVIVK